MLFVRSAKKDEKLLDQLAAVLQRMWDPMRFLADLEAVWPSLNNEQRQEIEDSRIYQNKHHQHMVEELAQQAKEITLQLKGHRNREVKEGVQFFLEHWQQQEPDQIKILLAQMKAAK
jgi:hypothetical protein